MRRIRQPASLAVACTDIGCGRVRRPGPECERMRASYRELRPGEALAVLTVGISSGALRLRSDVRPAWGTARRRASEQSCRVGLSVSCRAVGPLPVRAVPPRARAEKSGRLR